MVNYSKISTVEPEGEGWDLLKGNATLKVIVLKSKELYKQWILTQTWSKSVENLVSYRKLNTLTLVEWAPPFWIFNEAS